MFKILIVLSALMPVISIGQVPKVLSGTINHFQDFKSKFIASRNVDIWLPEGYSKKKKYAVLYMQDGQALFDSAVADDKAEWGLDEVVTKLTKEGKIKNCIVVGIWNTGKFRHTEYLPQKPFETFSKQEQDSLYKVKFTDGPMLAGKVQSDNYLRFLVKELKPFVDSKFSTLKDRENTFIAGSSMGGLISLYAVCEYPDIYGGAACLSTWWPGLMPSKNSSLFVAFNKYFQANLPSPQNHKLYFDNGTRGYDMYIKPLAPKVDSTVLNKGYTKENFFSQEFKDTGHSAKFWRVRMDIPIVFLLEKKQ
jgi:enterochelin esterase-like enzyme